MVYGREVIKMSDLLELESIGSRPITTLDVKLRDHSIVSPCNSQCPNGGKPDQCRWVIPLGSNSTQPHCKLLQLPISLVRES